MMMNKLKQIRILSLKCFIVASLPWEYMGENMGLDLERGLELFCSKN